MANSNEELLSIEIKTEFLEFSKQLEADEESIDETLDLFEKIKYAYCLEGNQIHWLLCLLYNIQHKNKILALEENENIKSLSIAKLLRFAKLGFKQFLSKTRKIQTILSFPKEFIEEINRIERGYNVTAILFSKYKSIYLDLFKNPFIIDDSTTTTKRTRNSRKPAFKSDDLFKFCWLLFIYVKEKFPAINGDLVNSYNLLLCCINLIYINVLSIDRHDLFNIQLDVKKADLQIFNVNFDANEDDDDGDDENNFDVNQSINLIIDYLCQHYDGLLIETKTINEHYFKTHIKYLIVKKILYGSPVTFLGLLESNRASNNEKSKFEFNCKNLNSNYEEFVTKYGDIDWRIFLNCVNDSEYFSYYAENYCFRDTDNTRSSDLNTMKPITANNKSNKILIQSGQNEDDERIQSINVLIKNQKLEISENLNELLCSLDNQKKNTYADFVKSYVNDNLKSIYLTSCSGNKINQEDYTYYDYALKLYFKVIESILANEKKRLIDTYQTSLIKLIQDEVFHNVLFSLCIEIVHFSMDDEKVFPWTMDNFHIEPYNFIRVIEVFIKNEESLSREQIRHLNSIETRILESFVWKNDSIIWSIIKRETVPAFEDICVVTSAIQPTSTSSDLIINLTPNTATAHSATSSPVTHSPGKHPAITRVVCSNANNSQASGSQGDLRITSSQIKKSDTIITTTTTTNLINKFHHNERVLVSSPLTTKRTTVICAHPQSPYNDKKVDKRKRSSSIGVFFRKFYNLATMRMNLLMENLEIPELVSKKIWNIFEYSIKNYVELMKDRHLDQIIMCAIHITCKVCSVNRQFQDIIRSYRIKSNSNNSNIYRTIFIRYNEQNEEIIGDLIQFYNEVYIENMKSYALKLATYNSRIAHNIQLSPVPKINIQTFSPRKIIDKQPVFVSPLKAYQNQAQRPKLTYSFTNGSFKDLEDINDMIKRSDLRVRTSKRRLLSESEKSDDESDSSSQNKVATLNPSLANFTKKLQVIKNDRLNIQ